MVFSLRVHNRKPVVQKIPGAGRVVVLVAGNLVRYGLDLRILGRIYGKTAGIELVIGLSLRKAQLLLHILHDLLGKGIHEIGIYGIFLALGVYGLYSGINVVVQGLFISLLGDIALFQHIPQYL